MQSSTNSATQLMISFRMFHDNTLALQLYVHRSFIIVSNLANVFYNRQEVLLMNFLHMISVPS